MHLYASLCFRTVVLAALAVCSAGAQTGPLVHVADGDLAGASGFGAESFLGVPFAAPPIGELRWRAPAPVKPWPGVRVAVHSAPACAALGSGDGPSSENEDCLYLNLYRPRGVRAGEKLPVMVFFHGGGNVWGSPGIYDGVRMAEVGHAVVVIPAYRVGVMGLLALPGMEGDAGDFMLEDQLAALRWVQRNVGAFGGDRADVTVSGQSAGSFDTSNLLASAQFPGLARQGILQSGPCRNGRSQTEAKVQGMAMAHRLGCMGDTPSPCMLGKGVVPLMDAWMAEVGVSSMPAWGSNLLPHGAADSVAAGAIARIPLLVGFARDEWWPFEHGLYPLSADGLEKQYAARFHDHAREVAALYPASGYPHREYALGAAIGDQTFICPAMDNAVSAARVTPVSLYEFADRTTPPFKSLGSNISRPEGYSPGAFHTAELQYLYNYQAAEGPLSEEQRRFGDELIQMWVGFNRAKPGGKEVFPVGSVEVLRRQGNVSETEAAVAEQHHCRFWGSF